MKALIKMWHAASLARGAAPPPSVFIHERERFHLRRRDRHASAGLFVARLKNHLRCRVAVHAGRLSGALRWQVYQEIMCRCLAAIIMALIKELRLVKYLQADGT